MEKLKIVTNLTGNIECEPIDSIFGFTQYNEMLTERKSLLAMGAYHTRVSDEVKSLPDYDEYYKMFFMPEEPQGVHCQKSYDGILSVENTFDLIFGQCPYFNEWREKYFDSPKRIHTFTPFDATQTFPSENKEIDVYWTGTSKAGTFIDTMQSTVSKFNHRIVNLRTSGNRAISHEEKLKLNGKSKISVTYALLFMKNEMEMKVSHFKECEAFKDYDKSGHIPQMKTRVYEAAFSKSIILHLKDSWNVIEKWFEPEKEFLYYDNEHDLEEKIHHILNNYGDYYHIAENAYNRAINNYTTQHFIDKYILPNTKLEM